MGWFNKISTSFLGAPSLRGLKLYNPEKMESLDNVYRSKDFPHVYLGGAEDLERVKELAGSVCSVIDVSQNLPEYKTWDDESRERIKPIFDSLVNQVANEITSKTCPIFVHCQVGMNRSAAVLASAISDLTGRHVFDVLKEMKSQRGVISPHDIYLYLASLHSSPEEQEEAKLLAI